MNIIFSSLHQIDHFNETISKKKISEYSTDLNRYVKKLFDEIVTSNSKRKFQFRSDTTEVRTAIQNIITGQYDSGSEVNASRLLKIEKDAQEKIAHLNIKIQKGSLFQAFIEQSNKTFILCKADHNDFLDEIDFSLRKGLPWEKRIFKAIMVNFNSNNSVSEVFIYDTNNRISKYWWYDFLELEEKYTDTHNTKTALDTLDKKIFTRIKKFYPADYMILRNSAIGYFRNNDEFDMNTFIKNTIENYHPVNEDFPLEETKIKVSLLPEKWGFDNRFEIKKDEIKKRIITKIPLAQSIDLVFNDHISNIRDLIDTEVDSQNNKWVKIKSEEGYKYFNK